MKKYKFGVLGAGNMGTAIAEGAVRAGRFAPEQVLMFNRSEEKRAAHAAKGYAVTGDYTEVYAESEIVLLAVKPQNFDEILPHLAKYEGEKPLVVSIAAGVTFAKLEGALGADTAMIRVMPNTPLMLGEGATQLVKNAAATDKQLSELCELFNTMGVTVTFEQENMLNEVIPYAGSAPAYLYAYADAFVQSAKQHGINEDDALTLICQTMIGSAKMLLRRDKTPAELIRAVCSPGGTTIEGDAHLLRLMKELVAAKSEYDHVADALRSVRETGYGLVTPTMNELTLQEPEIVQQGSRFGVRLKANAPSLHLIRVDIETEVSPVVGTEKQSEELVKYLLEEFQNDPQTIWNTNFFGKSLHELVREGLANKLMRMPVDAQEKVQETLSKIINEGNGGMICILL